MRPRSRSSDSGTPFVTFSFKVGRSRRFNAFALRPHRRKCDAQRASQAARLKTFWKRIRLAAAVYEDFRPAASLPIICAEAKGEATGALFFLFLSAFGFFFSRLLLCCPFAISILPLAGIKISRGSNAPLAFVPKTLEIGENGGYQLLSARVLRCGRRCKKGDQIPGFFRSFMPILCRRRQHVGFQLGLPMA